jgi:hypothetical protein
MTGRKPELSKVAASIAGRARNECDGASRCRGSRRLPCRRSACGTYGSVAGTPRRLSRLLRDDPRARQSRARGAATVDGVRRERGARDGSSAQRSQWAGLVGPEVAAADLCICLGLQSPCCSASGRSGCGAPRCSDRWQYAGRVRRSRLSPSSSCFECVGDGWPAPRRQHCHARCPRNNRRHRRSGPGNHQRRAERTDRASQPAARAGPEPRPCESSARDREAASGDYAIALETVPGGT